MFRTKVVIWTILVMVGILCAHDACAAAPPPRKAGEQELKAAYVLKFLEFVTWPDAMDRFTVCVAGDDALASELERLASGKTVQAVPVVISRRPSGEEAAGCAAMVLSGTARFPFAIANEPVLTIGNGIRFAEEGGVVGLYVERGLLHFAINPKAAAAARLRVSSHLLRLGRIVETRRTP